MEADYEAQLTQYVEDGKITAEQKQLILDKHKEMEADHEANKDAFQNMSEDERHARMETKRTELEAWAKENGIELKYLMPMVFGKGPGPGGHGFVFKQKLQNSDSANTKQ